MLCPQAESLPQMAWPDRGLSSLSVLQGGSRIWDNTSIYKFLEDFSFASRHRSNNTRLRLPPPHLEGREATAEPSLPEDPTDWSREDVSRWIQYVSTTHRLPTIHLERFVMNGKALCLMSMDMFVRRVPLGGKLLWKDFQLRLSKVHSVDDERPLTRREYAESGYCSTVRH